MRKANLKTLELTVDRPAAHPATAARGLHLAETEQLCNLAYPAYPCTGMYSVLIQSMVSILSRCLNTEAWLHSTMYPPRECKAPDQRSKRSTQPEWPTRPAPTSPTSLTSPFYLFLFLANQIKPLDLDQNIGGNQGPLKDLSEVSSLHSLSLILIIGHTTPVCALCKYHIILNGRREIAAQIAKEMASSRI